MNDERGKCDALSSINLCRFRNVPAPIDMLLNQPWIIQNDLLTGACDGDRFKCDFPNSKIPRISQIHTPRTHTQETRTERSRTKTRNWKTYWIIYRGMLDDAVECPTWVHAFTVCRLNRLWDGGTPPSMSDVEHATSVVECQSTTPMRTSHHYEWRNPFSHRSTSCVCDFQLNWN